MNAFSHFPLRRWFSGVLLGAAALIGSPLVRAANAAEPTSDLATLDYSGNQAALAALDTELAAARQDPTKLAALQQRLIAVVRDDESTFAARQAACQRLGLLLPAAPSESLTAALRALRPLLTDDRDVDLARLALESVPGSAVDAVILEALERAGGRARLGLVQMLGRRHSENAVPALAGLARSPDDELATAAVSALGETGGPGSVEALAQVPTKHAVAITQAKLQALRRVPRSDAIPILRAIQEDRAVAKHLRAAAFRISLDAEPAAAGDRILAVLDGDDWDFKAAALEAVSGLSADAIVPKLAAKLAGWDPATQVAVLASFTRAGHAAAVPATVNAAANEDSAVRQAAIATLGFLPGNADIARQLALIASRAEGAEARAARASLTRLDGPDVNRTVLSEAERGEPALRVVYIEQLASRAIGEAVSLLLRCRNEPDGEVRIAAVDALGELGSMAEQPALIAWVQAASAEEERTRAIRALANLTLRNPDSEARGAAIHAAVEKAPPELGRQLLPVLSRLGGRANAGCAARLALREDSSLAEPAVDTLARWTDGSALDSLATVAEKAPAPDIRRAALDGALRYLERNREPWNPDSTKLIARLAGAATELESQARILTLLRRANDRAAIRIAKSISSNPSLAEAGREAIDVIEANRAGPPNARGSGNQRNLKNIMDGRTGTRWSVAANGDEWLEIDFRRRRPLQTLILDQTGRVAEFPERYEVFVTDDPRAPGAARASGAGQRMRTTIALPAGTRGRYVIIRNTADRSDSSWSISELYVD